MREKQSLFKMPGEDPVIVWSKPNPKSIIDKVGGAFYRTDIQLSTGKKVVLFYYQMSVRDGCEYNFTICPTEDKRTWIDICGPVLVMAPDDADLDLEVEECEELFRVPYEY